MWFPQVERNGGMREQKSTQKKAKNKGSRSIRIKTEQLEQDKKVERNPNI